MCVLWRHFTKSACYRNYIVSWVKHVLMNDRVCVRKIGSNAKHKPPTSNLGFPTPILKTQSVALYPVLFNTGGINCVRLHKGIFGM